MGDGKTRVPVNAGTLAQPTSNLQPLLEVREHVAAGLGHGHHVLDPHPAQAREVQPGLNRDDRARFQALGELKARGLVDLQPQAVARAVEEPARPATPWGNPGP